VDKIRQFQNLNFNETLRQQQLLEEAKVAQQQYENQVKVYALIAGLLFTLCLAFILVKSNRHKQKANVLLQQQKQEIQNTLTDLKATQAELVRQEKINQFLKMQAVRNRIARDLHDDMGSTISSIQIFSDTLKLHIQDNKTEMYQPLDKISTMCRTLYESMQDIVWSVDTKYDSFEDLIRHFREHALPVAEAKNIQLKIEPRKMECMHRLTPDEKHNIYFIAKEAFNNAVKYSHATEVVFSTDVFDLQLLMKIADNGIGFNESQTAAGNGLVNMKQRAEEIKGKLVIQSCAGKGTVILLQCPIA